MMTYPRLRQAVRTLNQLLIAQEELEYKKANIVGLDTDCSLEVALQSQFEKQQAIILDLYKGLDLSAHTQDTAEPLTDDEELTAIFLNGTASINDLWEIFSDNTEADLEHIDQALAAAEDDAQPQQISFKASDELH